MAAKLTFTYDREGDILYVDKRAPHPEQESEELGDDVIARLDPATGEVEGARGDVLFHRLLRSQTFELPIDAILRMVAAS